MKEELLKQKFGDIGAELVIRPSSRWQRSPVALDVRESGGREYFDVSVQPRVGVELEIITVDRDRRHLLLLERRGTKKHKYLCGHDERHWFVAAVPESTRGVTSIESAFRALRPAELVNRQASRPLPVRESWRRHNSAFIRQGEWFFVPAPDLSVPPLLILRNEPISRGRGKPHHVECLYRRGGETVYVCHRVTAGLPEFEYRALLKRQPQSRNWRWSVLRRNPEVFAAGRVRHADHATINLNGWHRVLMNTENRAEAGRNVVFLD